MVGRVGITQDAQTFADWEVDFMKLDCCNTSVEMKNVSYPKWSKALNATGRPIVYRSATRDTTTHTHTHTVGE